MENVEMENSDLIILRDKFESETQGEYMEYIKKEIISNANNKISDKNAELSELKSERESLKAEISQLKMEKAVAENDQLNTALLKTEDDLRDVINDIKKALIDNKKSKSSDISKLSDLVASLEDKVSNYGKDNKINDIIEEQEKMSALLNEFIETYKNDKEDILNKIGNVDRVEENDVIKQDQVENEVTDEIAPVLDTPVEEVNEEVKEDENVLENPENDINLNGPIVPMEDSVTPEFGVNSFDAGVENNTSDVAPVEEVTEEVKEETPVENGFDQVVNQEEIPQAPVEEAAQENTNIDPIPNELIEPLIEQQYSAAGVKATRTFVNSVKDPNYNFVLKTQPIPVSEIPQDLIDKFNENITNSNQEVATLSR